MDVNETPQKIKYEELAEAVKLVPLVSIDLIIENAKGQILLGMRNNEPAKGFWFVPGGRILKNERIPQALERIAKDELGLKIEYCDFEFVGVFEHLYPTNFAQKEGFGTHYIVLAHKMKILNNSDIIADSQHKELVWFDKQRILNDDKVHTNTKAYFKGTNNG